MKLKKLPVLMFLLVVALLLCLWHAPTTEAATIVDSGSCGDNLTWTLDDEGTLTISGSGPMDRFGSRSSPWYDNDSIKTVILEDDVTTVGMFAFSGCDGLTDVILPDSITAIGESTFLRCTSLADINIPRGVDSIGQSAFSGCSSLAEITIPDRITSLQNYTFQNCTSLKNVTIENGIWYIERSVFSKCIALTQITLPDSLRSIGDSAFSGCSSLTEITIPASVTAIGRYAFNDCPGLTAIWVDENNFDYSSDARGVLFSKDKGYLIQAPGKISGCYTIPDSVTGIEIYAFHNCTLLTSVFIPGSVAIIDYDTFHGCAALNSVTIPGSVTQVRNSAFSGCAALKDVYYAGTQNQWNSILIDSLNDCLTSATIHYGHIHDYTQSAPTKVDATCTKNGSITYICKHGDTKQEVIPALGHGVGTVTAVIAPTCINQGYTITACPRCGESGNSNFTDPLDHDFSGEITVVPSSCTEKGYTLTSCIRCTATEKSNYTDLLDHELKSMPAEDATCTVPGKTAGTKCMHCDYWDLKPTEIPKLGHDFVDGICTRCQQTNSGDMDGDDAINDADAMYLLRHTLFPSRYPISLDGDVNSDGTVNDADAMYLLRYTLFPTRYPLYPKKN